MPLNEAVSDRTSAESSSAREHPVATSLLRKVHGLNGVLVLGGYTCLHLVQGFSALSSREAWVDRVSMFPLANAATIVVLVGLVTHVVTGLALSRQHADDPVAAIEPTAALGLRRLQQLTGLVLLAVFAVHLIHLWPLTRHDPLLARSGYVALQHWLETPSGLAFYVLATTALAFHLSHGLSRLLVSVGIVRGTAGLRVTRYLAGALGIALWCLTLHWVGHFANGVGVWPITGEDDPLPKDASGQEGELSP